MMFLGDEGHCSERSLSGMEQSSKAWRGKGSVGGRRPGHCPNQEVFSRSASFSETLETSPVSVACGLFMALGSNEIKQPRWQARLENGHEGSVVQAANTPREGQVWGK